LFQVERNDDGSVRIVLPEVPSISPERAYRNTLFLNGITEPEIADAMWADEKARRAAKAAEVKAKQLAARQRRAAQQRKK
jgi:hypothetical protein